MIEFSIDESVLDRHPAVAVLGFLAEVASLAGNLDTIAILPTPFPPPDSLASHPLLAPWRAAAKAGGLKPSEFRSSPEQLVRRWLLGKEIRTEIPLVDLYCAVSVSYIVPLGAYDVDRLPGSRIELRIARSTDHFSPLGSNSMPVDRPVVVYACGDTILCFNFNHRDSAETCLLADTRRAVFFGEAITIDQTDALEKAMADLRSRLARGGAHLGRLVSASSSKRSVELNLEVSTLSE